MSESSWREWSQTDARSCIAVPTEGSDKYSRGVLGVQTGSADFPGAAVLGVEAAMRTGVGMVRYRGPGPARSAVLARRPEVVTGGGRVQAWLVGSGMDSSARSAELVDDLRGVFADGVPVVVDAGALDLIGRATGEIIVTPHSRELARMFANDAGVDVDADAVDADPAGWAVRAAEEFGVTVLLKGSTTHVATAGGQRLRVSGSPGWLATAGTGDVLGGILGALVATHARRMPDEPALAAELAITASYVHAEAARIASRGGPIAALDVAEAVPAAITSLLRSSPTR